MSDFQVMDRAEYDRMERDLERLTKALRERDAYLLFCYENCVQPFGLHKECPESVAQIFTGQVLKEQSE